MANDNQKGTALIGGAVTDEVMESSDSIMHRGSFGSGIKGLQQFYTPLSAAKLIADVIGSEVAVLDPTAGDGSLLKYFGPTLSFGVEIDKDQIKASEGTYNPIRGDLQHVYALLKLAENDWGAIVANPPFGLTWEDPTIRNGKPTNSTVMTFIMVNRLLHNSGQFAFIAGRNRWDRQITKLPEYESVYAEIEVDNLFEGTTEACVIGFGLNPECRTTDISHQGVRGRRNLTLDMLDMASGWVKEMRDEAKDTYSRLRHDQHYAYHRVEHFKSIQVEYDRRVEKRIKTREFDAQLYNGNHIQWLPSAFAKLALQEAGMNYDFEGLNQQPVAYFAQNERLYFKLADAAERGLITIDPLLTQATSHILGDIQRFRVPLYKLKVQQRLGFLDDIDSLLCIKDSEDDKFVAGERYQIDTSTKTIVVKEDRPVESKKEPGEYSMKTFEQHKKVMSITMSGHGAHRSMYDGGDQASQNIKWLIDHFELPDPGDVADRHPEEIERLVKIVKEVFEEMKVKSTEWEKDNPHSMPFTIRDFQVQDIARLLFKGFGLLAWEQGLGKTAGGVAFYLAATKMGAKEKLLVVTAADLIPQWTREFERFAGKTPEVIKTHGQAHRIAKFLRLGGKGVYITNYEALAINGTLRANKPLPVVTVKEWPEQRVVKGTDKYGNYYWTAPGEGELEGHTVYANDAIAWSQSGIPSHDEDGNELYGSAKLRALRDAGWWQIPTKESTLLGHDGTEYSPDYGYLAARWETITKKLTSRDLCPECQADTRNGWNGLYCESEDAAGQKCGYSHFSVRMKPIASLLSTAYHDGCILLDEITYMQGDASKRSIALRGLQAKYRLGLTGTPIKNYVHQIFWPLAWCLGYDKPWFPFGYDGGLTRFQDDFCVIEYRKAGNKREARRVCPDVTNLSRFWRMLSSCTIRRRMEETGEELVDIFYNEVHVPLGLKQAEQTKEWLKKLPDGFPGLFKEKYPDHALVANGMVDVWAPMIGLNWKLDYAATIPQGDPDWEWTEIAVTNWTPANLKALELTMALVKSGRKVLFGSHLVPTGQWMAERLVEKGVNAVHIVDSSGTTASAKKRAQHVYSFQNDESVQVFCAGMKAIRLGHNLDAANAVVLNGLDFDYETLDQFIKRVRRLTSTKDIDVYVILPTLSGQETITSRKWQLLGMKGNAADLALDGQLIKKVEQEITEAEMIRELQNRGLNVTEDAVPESEVERAWELLPPLGLLDDFEAMIPLRPEKEADSVEAVVTEEGGETHFFDSEKKEIPADVGIAQEAEPAEEGPDEIDLAEAEFASQVEFVVALGEGEDVPEIVHAGDADPEDILEVVEGILPLIPMGGVPADPAPDEEDEVASPETEDMPEALFDANELVSDATKSDESSWDAKTDPVAMIKGAKGLLDMGILDQAEFDAIKTAQMKLMGVGA